MNLTQSNLRTFFAVALLTSTPLCSIEAQNTVKLPANYNTYQVYDNQVPATSAEKLEALKKGYDESFREFSTLLNQLPAQPSTLGTKDLFKQIDVTDRKMQSARAKIKALVTSLRNQEEKIGGNASFSDTQKKELIEASQVMISSCETMLTSVDLGVQRLKNSYKIFQNWKQVYTTYNDLQGGTKASEILKTHIDDYLISFTPQEAEESSEAEE